MYPSFQKLVFLLVLGTILSIGPVAHAAKLSIVGAGDFSNLNVDPSTTTVLGNSVNFSTSSKFGLGGGLLLGGDLAPGIELETGGLYITRKYQLKTSVLGLTQTDAGTAHAIQVPLLLRAHLSSLISVGVGAYAAIGIGDVTDENDGGISGTPSTTTGSYSSQGLKNKDYGLLASIGLNFPLSSSTSFLVDGRYALGLTDVNASPGNTTPAVTQKFRDLQILAGLQFSLDGHRR